jgi:hypothetical protein
MSDTILDVISTRLMAINFSEGQASRTVNVARDCIMQKFDLAVAWAIKTLAPKKSL